MKNLDINTNTNSNLTVIRNPLKILNLYLHIDENFISQKFKSRH